MYLEGEKPSSEIQGEGSVTASCNCSLEGAKFKSPEVWKSSMFATFFGVWSFFPQGCFACFFILWWKRPGLAITVVKSGSSRHVKLLDRHLFPFFTNSLITFCWGSKTIYPRVHLGVQLGPCLKWALFRQANLCVTDPMADAVLDGSNAAQTHECWDMLGEG